MIGPNRFRYLVATGLAIALPTMIGCQGGDDLVAATSPEFQLVEVDATVDGRSIDGATMHLGHDGGPVRFEARLANEGRPAAGHTVRVEYDVPGMGGRRRAGVFLLHDDGTQGDVIPHDGLYCYEDSAGEYGCHGPGARPGEHRYDFCGVRQDGLRTERRRITAFLLQ